VPAALKLQNQQTWQSVMALRRWRPRAFFMSMPGEAGKLFEKLIQLQRPFVQDDPEVQQILERCGWEILAPSPF
jgi:hypothetical protein